MSGSALGEMRTEEAQAGHGVEAGGGESGCGDLGEPVRSPQDAVEEAVGHGSLGFK